MVSKQPSNESFDPVPEDERDIGHQILFSKPLTAFRLYYLTIKAEIQSNLNDSKNNKLPRRLFIIKIIPSIIFFIYLFLFFAYLSLPLVAIFYHPFLIYLGHINLFYQLFFKISIFVNIMFTCILIATIRTKYGLGPLVNSIVINLAVLVATFITAAVAYNANPSNFHFGG